MPRHLRPRRHLIGSTPPPQLPHCPINHSTVLPVDSLWPVSTLAALLTAVCTEYSSHGTATLPHFFCSLLFYSLKIPHSLYHFLKNKKETHLDCSVPRTHTSPDAVWCLGSVSPPSTIIHSSCLHIIPSIHLDLLRLSLSRLLFLSPHVRRFFSRFVSGPVLLCSSGTSLGRRLGSVSSIEDSRSKEKSPDPGVMFNRPGTPSHFLRQA